MEMFLDGLIIQYPVAMKIASILGLIMVVAQAVVLLTPSKKDNEFIAKVFAVPMLGAALKHLIKYAPFNEKHKK
jgi:hypothetical protein